MTTNKPTPNSEQRPRKKLMSFKKFVVSKRREQRLARNTSPPKGRAKLTEETVDLIDADVRNSIFASIPAQASDREIAIEILADKLRKMTETMDIVVTCVGFGSEDNSALPRN